MGGGAIRTSLITGGAGFIGSNLAARLLSEPDHHVRILDNLSRGGVEHNVRWLQSRPGAYNRLEIVRGDVRNLATVTEAARDADSIYHLAAQVAVTTSVTNPVEDFAINALGTLHVLEAARASRRNPFVLFTSTNKVYGSLEEVQVEVQGLHYRAADPSFNGIAEHQLLDFHSPYGCSKGAADQYVRDYGRIYDLRTVVFRMSCIAGPRQFGNEDQGWVAHFLYSALAGNPITVYGDGFQVRDILHVDDLTEAILKAEAAMDHTAGEIYNVGGGPERVISVIEMLRAIERRTGTPLKLEYSDVRPGDQPLYVSDTRKLQQHTGWRPQRSLEQTLADLHAFWHENREIIAHGSMVALEAQEVA